MKREKWAALAMVLFLLAGAASMLLFIKGRQRLGAPGLKLATVPMLDEHGKVVAPVSVELPSKVLGYNSTNGYVSDIELGYLPKDTTYGRRRYVHPDGPFAVDVSVVLMGADRTSIHKPEICLVGQGWKRSEPEFLTVPIERPHHYDLPVTRIRASRPFKFSNGTVADVSGVYVYWFVSENHLTASHRERFWLSLKGLLTTGVMPRWAYVSCFSLCRPGDEQATFERMKHFIAAAVPEFQLPSLADAVEAGSETALVQ